MLKNFPHVHQPLGYRDCRAIHFCYWIVTPFKSEPFLTCLCVRLFSWQSSSYRIASSTSQPPPKHNYCAESITMPASRGPVSCFCIVVYAVWLLYFCQYSLEPGPALPAHSSRLEFPEEERTNGHSAAFNQGLKRWCLNSPTSSSHGGCLWGTWCSVLTVPCGKWLDQTLLVGSPALLSLQCSLPHFLNGISLNHLPHTQRFWGFFMGKENKVSSILFQMKKPKCRENKWSIHATASNWWHTSSGI